MQQQVQNCSTLQYHTKQSFLFCVCEAVIEKNQKSAVQDSTFGGTVKLHKRGPLLQTAGHPFSPATWPA